MNEIIGVIDSLAFQTHILAFNAAVEAARTGEQSRGFAVVASEVRSLALRSAGSARGIRQLIQGSSVQVSASVVQIWQAGTNMDRIVDGIREVAMNMAQISRVSSEQSTDLAQITVAIASSMRSLSVTDRWSVKRCTTLTSWKNGQKCYPIRCRIFGCSKARQAKPGVWSKQQRDWPKRILASNCCRPSRIHLRLSMTAICMCLYSTPEAIT